MTVPSEKAEGDPVLVGVVSDTHGRVHPHLSRAFSGVSRIIHAGDVGPGLVLEELAAIAPVTAVAGNVDLEPPASLLPAVARVTIGRVRFVVAHVVGDAERAAGGPAETDVVVFGHSHVPSAEVRSGVLFLNPGSASRGRLGSGRQVCLLELRGTVAVPRFLHLDMLG